jgi:hypothetical protein
MVRCGKTAREGDDRIDVTNEAKKRPSRRRGSARRRRSPAAAVPAPPPVEPLQDEPLPEASAPLVLASPPEPEPPFPDDLALDTPEIEFAQRAAARPPEPERPWPARRRVVFFDVENTSRMQHIGRVIDHLALDRVGTRTDFIAVGNWRVIGHDTGRLLARHGAQLVHSAPAVGVRDWSDLRIAVAAGVWLGAARPGDVLEIVSDDRAFDAVGDVATSLGIAFRRLSYRGLTDQPRAVEPAPEPIAASREAGSGDRRGGRYRRGRGGRGRYDRPVPAPVVPVPAAIESEAEPHTAPHDELLGVARDLIFRAPSRTVTLDTLANALKARGFSRPPGSPRLITRLRRIRELQINRAGQITLVDSDSAQPWTPPPPPISTPVLAVVPREPSVPAPREAVEPAPVRTAPVERTFEQRRAEVEAALRGESVPAYSAPVDDELDSIGNAPSGDDAPAESAAPGDPPRRRRSRRGGRRRRRHGAPAAG